MAQHANARKLQDTGLRSVTEDAVHAHYAEITAVVTNCRRRYLPSDGHLHPHLKYFPVQGVRLVLWIIDRYPHPPRPIPGLPVVDGLVLCHFDKQRFIIKFGFQTAVYSDHHPVDCGGITELPTLPKARLSPV